MTKISLKKFLIFLLVFINLGNHFTESTLKQFFYERGKFKPDFDAAFEIIKKSETNKIILYREAKIDKKPDHNGIVLSNYVHTIIKNKKYEINLYSKSQ